MTKELARVSDDTQSQGGAAKIVAIINEMATDQYGDPETSEDISNFAQETVAELIARGVLCVSDGSPEGGKTGTGLIEDDSAAASAETPHPSPVDYTEVVERLREYASEMQQSYTSEICLDAAQVIEAQAAENEKHKEDGNRLFKIGIHHQDRAEAAEAENATLKARIAELELANKCRRAPVQGLTGGIPWSMHLKAYDVYAAKYGESQSAERLAGRGGFHVGELDMFIPGWREELSEITTLRARLADAVKVIERTERANEKLCSLRTHEQYLAMIDSGQQEALLELDEARSAARSFLSTGGDSHG